MQRNEELTAHLTANPHIAHVYLNEEGGWLFFSHPAFPNQVSREDYLSEEAPKEETTLQTTKTRTKK